MDQQPTQSVAQNDERADGPHTGGSADAQVKLDDVQIQVDNESP